MTTYFIQLQPSTRKAFQGRDLKPDTGWVAANRIVPLPFSVV